MRKKLSKQKKALCLKRILFLSLIIIFAMLQNVPHLMPGILGSRALVLIPLAVCLGMFEKALSAAFYGAFAGALWDITVARGDGYNALILMIFAVTSSLLISYLMRNNISTAALLGGGAVIVYLVLHWFIFVVCSGTQGGIITIFTFYLPSAIYTFVFVPLTYILLRAILRKIKKI